MTQAHWFSNQCPYFHVLALELFHARFGVKTPVTSTALEALNVRQAANWFNKNFDAWRSFLEKTRQIEDARLAGKFQMTKWGDACFPQFLRRIHYPPSVLFHRGRLDILERPTVAIVGARHPTDLGRQWVQKAVPQLVEAGFTIVSGGARGIDAEAHWAAIKANGHTAAFLPGSVDRPYPSGNHDMFEKILAKGALISEFSPGTDVRPENFHRRNRLIAGSARVVVIVEASERSGTLMTALWAVKESVEVLVVPGSPLVPTYGGSLNLLAQGAGLARHAQDVIDVALQKNTLKKEV